MTNRSRDADTGAVAGISITVDAPTLFPVDAQTTTKPPSRGTTPTAWPLPATGTLGGVVPRRQPPPAVPRRKAREPSPGPPGGGCTVSVSRAEDWPDRFNTTFSVSGTGNWVVTIRTNGGQTLQSSWNASVSGTSGTLTARPNGNGNNFGITLYKNGNNTTPTASCAAG